MEETAAPTSIQYLSHLPAIRPASCTADAAFCVQVEGDLRRILLLASVNIRTCASNLHWQPEQAANKSILLAGRLFDLRMSRSSSTQSLLVSWPLAPSRESPGS